MQMLSVGIDRPAIQQPRRRARSLVLCLLGALSIAGFSAPAAQATCTGCSRGREARNCARTQAAEYASCNTTYPDPVIAGITVINPLRGACYIGAEVGYAACLVSARFCPCK